MGFSQNIRSNAVPEWKDYYINYDMLHTKLKHKSFKSSIYNELKKVNNFFFLLEKKAVDEKNKIFDDVFADNPNEDFEDLRIQTETADDEKFSDNKSIQKITSKNIMHTADESLSSSTESKMQLIKKDEKLSNLSGFRNFIKIPKTIKRRKKEKNITEFLHSLIKITTYKNLNSSAMLRLAKRHSEIKKDDDFYKEFSHKLETSYFYTSKRIELIRMAIKQLYRRMFAKDQPEKARKIFKQIKKGSKTSDWQFILSGMIISISCMLSISLHSPNKHNQDLFWGINIIYLGFILFGFCLKVFKHSKINYKFIFNFDVCSSMTNASYLMIISLFLLFHTLSFLIQNIIYSKKFISFTTKSIIEFITIFIQWVSFFLPYNILFYNSRIYLIGIYARAFFQPFSRIKFRHFYFVDVALSYIFTLESILFFIGIKNENYLTLILLLLPLIRIMQCINRFTASTVGFPHIINCFKFFIGIIFKISKLLEKNYPTFKKVTIFLGICNASGGMLWDMFMDWHIIRNRFIFPKFVYPFIVLFSSIVRFTWVLKYFLVNLELKKIEAILEIVRRFLWTLIRVEVEHLNNCDELRTKNIINLTNGELFYKKDLEKEDQSCDLQTSAETGTETETDFERTYQNSNRIRDIYTYEKKYSEDWKENQADDEEALI